MILSCTCRQALMGTVRGVSVHLVFQMVGLRGISNQHSLVGYKIEFLTLTKVYITLFLWTIAQEYQRLVLYQIIGFC